MPKPAGEELFPCRFSLSQFFNLAPQEIVDFCEIALAFSLEIDEPSKIAANAEFRKTSKNAVFLLRSFQARFRNALEKTGGILIFNKAFGGYDRHLAPF